MKATILYPLLTLTGGMLFSCVYYANPVPEMPYRANRNVAHPVPQAPQPSSPTITPPPSAALPEAPWATALPGARPAAPEQQHAAPKEAPKEAPAPKPISKPVHEISSPTPPTTSITPPSITAPALPKPAPATPPTTDKQPSAPTTPPLQPLPEPKISTPQAPRQTPASSANKPSLDKKLITNDGPIPYATKVEGDPTRVYNPLDPNKTIRITDKNGNIYPSGKELKVKGTNYHFYVP